jgi:glycosyltransferase involved in cell wall biosynthesis
MACKKPILMVIDGVSRELVEDAACGIYVEPENPEDFKEKVIHYLNMSEEDRNKEGESGYKYAKEHFDRTQLAYKYLNHIQTIAKK